MKVADLPLVLIEWEDSFGVGPSWEPIPDDLDPAPASCFSAGWLVAENDRVVTLVPHIHDADESIGAVLSGCGDMTIPKSCILKRTDLKAGKK